MHSCVTGECSHAYIRECFDALSKHVRKLESSAPEEKNIEIEQTGFARPIPGTLVLYFKSPDVLRYVMEDFPDETREDARKFYQERLTRWLKFNSMLTVEFDFIDMTAQVLVDGDGDGYLKNKDRIEQLEAENGTLRTIVHDLFWLAWQGDYSKPEGSHELLIRAGKEGQSPKESAQQFLEGTEKNLESIREGARRSLRDSRGVYEHVNELHARLSELETKNKKLKAGKKR